MVTSSPRLIRFLTFNFISVALLPIIVFGLISLSILTKNMEKEIRRENLLLAHHLSSQVEQFLGEPLNLLRQIGEVIISRELIRTPEVNEFMESVMGNYGLFDSIVILDDQAMVRHRAPYNASYIGISMWGNGYVRQAYETDRPVWSSTFISIDTGEPTIHLIYPRLDRTAIVGYLNLGTLTNLIDGMDLGLESRVFLVDQKGVVIAHHDEDWVTHRRNISSLEMVKKALAGHEGTFRQQLFGANSLGSVAVVPGTGWVVLVIQPESEVLAPVRRIRVLFWTGSLVALLLALLVALSSIKQTLKPLNHLLAQTRRIAEGDYRFEEHIDGFQEIDALTAGFKFMAEAVKTRETALSASESKYRELVENANSVILRLNPEGRITFFNEFAQRFFNMTENEVLGQKIVETIVPANESSGRDLGRLIAELLADPEKHPISENENIRFNGERVWVSWTNKPVYDEEGRLSEILCVGIDITARKMAEDRLREALDRLDATMNALPDLLFETDPFGVIHDFRSPDPGSHYPAPDHFIGKKVGDVLPPRAADALMEAIKKAHTHGSHSGAVYSQEIKGEVRWCETSIARKGEPGSPDCRLIALARDITARKKLEFQLQQAHKMEAVGTLAGGIAHDFNNLLQAISGYAQIILLRSNENEDGRREVNEIIKVCDRAALLIQQLLTFSRKVESRKRLIDVNREVRQVKDLFDRTLPRMIDVELRLSDQLMAVNADPVQVEQILMNLGSNARDAMPDGGRLIIETTNVLLDQAYCRYNRGAVPGDYVLISVTDTGQGMDRDTLEHIFEPFFSTKELGKGTGLGLASVYGIVKKHNGYITCQSEVGQGAVFKIYLPASESRSDQAEETGTSDQVQGGRETILVVDDDAWIRDTAHEILRHYGYRVLLASSGEQAVEIYTSHAAPIDLVILDLSMPGMGGHKCMRALMAYDPQVKVLIASGYSSDTEVRDTIELGAVGFLPKPFQLKDIAVTVRKVFDG